MEKVCNFSGKLAMETLSGHDYNFSDCFCHRLYYSVFCHWWCVILFLWGFFPPCCRENVPVETIMKWYWYFLFTPKCLRLSNNFLYQTNININISFIYLRKKVNFKNLWGPNINIFRISLTFFFFFTFLWAPFPQINLNAVHKIWVKLDWKLSKSRHKREKHPISNLNCINTLLVLLLLKDGFEI